MAIKAIIELKAHPGKRDELKAFIDNLVATYGPGGPGFIRSTRYEVLGDPDRLVEIAEWESVEAREAHILVGNGTKLFKDGRPELKLKLVSIKQFDKGLSQLHYRRADK